MFKVFVITTLFLGAYAEYLGELQGYGGHVGGEIEYGGHEEHHNHHPKYQFNYAVHDPHTGDEKQHIEERDGDQVKGTYTLKEADGTTRVVEYKADKHNGFNAVVHKIGEPHQHGGQIGGVYGGHY
ncbi:cuticle protein 8-like [Tribolium madens]|uniref:cuticle protein 8-like n=1 Tax=Tribolium madens TaxID=41895 RepID=UPI001CF73397|nr:cuticle protein 8-like [Tribolium madens]